MLFLMFALRIIFAQGWYIGMYHISASAVSIATKQPLTQYSRLLTRHLPPEPLPRLHKPQIRPIPRERHRHGRRRTRRSIVLTTNKSRPRVQALRAASTGVQVLAFSDEGNWDRVSVLLESDIQSAGGLAGAGDLLVDIGVFDDEEADTEYDQVQVSYRALEWVGHQWIRRIKC